MSQNFSSSYYTQGTDGPPAPPRSTYPQQVNNNDLQPTNSNSGSSNNGGNSASHGNSVNNAKSGQSHPSEGTDYSSSSSNSNQNANSGSGSYGSNPLIYGNAHMGPYPHGNSNSSSNPISGSMRANPGTQGK
ncbi:hypothetical protein JMJ35_007348 [Cladonia borealis]|uniref:Uncharacterized protein n=1 Tax=Cladonia borealis TaxID=184061 RepID=A0AA39V3I9_9LECA|nr:hypothetical protein JMJ35_007348 [Cladonia borealis]